jgi:hypothetical protein
VTDRPRDDEARIEIVLSDGRRVGLRGPVDRQALADVLAVLTSSSADPEPRPTGSVDREHWSC